MTGHTRLLFLDDSKQNKAPRDGLNGLVAIGGISVAADKANELHKVLNDECLSKFGIPSHASFKWSPSKDSWFRTNLSSSERGEVLKHVLLTAQEYDLFAVAALCEISFPPFGGATSHEMCALMMAMERFNWNLSENDTGLVIIDRPAGSKTDEENYLANCADIVSTGSDYVKFTKLACPIVSMPFGLSRILQIADLIVSITTAHFAGHPRAAEFFLYVLPFFKIVDGRRGGVSVKMHPHREYRNLYHWLLGDDYFVRSGSGFPMPDPKRPYPQSPDTY
ncbi:hypothetical protein ACIGGE_16275 [Qipengyuania sp. NPDC077410]|uniref:hypothetical protein n=1 Tax=Qipengyuania sp. NPDC077410 TaxID=3364496 RepID=UPI0037C70DEF